MAAKSPTELIRDIQTEITRLTERLTILQAFLDNADVVAIRERLAVVESQVAELKKREDENDRRRWQLWLAIGVCILTFGANLTMNLILFFTRVKS